jgi:PPOX class probable F420-dependent enzyme
MATLTEGQARLFLDPNYGVAAAIRPDGTVQLTTVWVDWDGEHVLFNTAEGRWKPRYLRRNPRASVYVADKDDPYKWVSITGAAELTHEGADDHIDKLAKKYTGHDTYPWRKEGEQRIVVKIRPERVTAYGV